MKSIQNALLAYSAGKFILATGTVIVLFNVATGLVPHWPHWAQGLIALFIVAVLLPLLDGAWDYLEDALRSMNGQSPAMAKSQITLFFILGSLGVAGSIFLSIISASMLSNVVVDDKSGTAAEIDSTKSKSDAAYLQLVATAERNVTRAENRLNAAEAKNNTAKKDGAQKQGGEFARLARQGNDWIWTRDAEAYAPHRQRVAAYEKQAAQELADAQKALADAQAAYNDVITTGRAESTTATAAVVGAKTVVLNKWLADLKTTTGFFIRIDVGAGVFCFLLLFLLFKAKAIPDDRTIMEVFTKAVRLTSEAFVYALGVSVDAAEAQVKGIGFISHPLPGGVPPASVPPPPANTNCTPQGCTPASGQSVSPATKQAVPPVPVKKSAPPLPGVQKRSKYTAEERRELHTLKGKIKGYTRRQKEGTLSAKGEATLEGYKLRRAAIQEGAKNRKA